MLAGRPVVPVKSFFQAEVEAVYERPARTATEYPRRSDVDNIAKLVLDALQGHAFDNDSLCHALTVSKKWGDADSVTITLRW